ncbi:hypothetical protein Syun_009703 [Stephania yunnanensis]|uniref:Kinesin motor domain-containing protein n=1 Tax=Stephania yunnanensis TaxID=152371 RepID=A0AAP0KH70_9MAGN
MKSSGDYKETRILGGVSTRSIRNLLPRTLSTKQSKMNSSRPKSRFTNENASPLDTNIQIDKGSDLSSAPEKPLAKKKPSLSNVTAELDCGQDQSAVVAPSDPSVKVVVRIRPASWRERGQDRTVRKVSVNSLSVGERSFGFDSVVDTSSTQEDIFQLVGVPLVKNSLAGFNTSILAYGQTGSGKTYTMWGPPSAMLEGHSASSNQGIVPRIFHMLFEEFDREQQNSDGKQINFQCRCSFLEIYNGQIGDLLDPTQRNLQIKDDTKNVLFVENLTEEYVNSYDDVTQVLVKALSNRKVGATSVNSKSSRSHIIFNFVVESWCEGNSSKSISRSKISRISLIDLAGSDRNKLDDANRQCAKESKSVKKSLSQLGHLVRILGENKRSRGPKDTPYQSSCLTHLLQESLGGNAKLSVICAISPVEKCLSETLSTLRFGLRVKAIQNTPVINEITEDDVNDLSDQIRQLKEELIKSKSVGYRPVFATSGYFKGQNARESLHHLRLSLNRSLILPKIDNDSDEEINVDEDDVKNLCTQLDKLDNSCETNSKDSSIEQDFFEEISDADTTSENNDGESPCVEENKIKENHLDNPERKSPHEENVKSITEIPISSDPMVRNSLSILPSRQPSVLQDPTLSESPRIEENTHKQIFPTSSSLSVSKANDVSKFNSEVLRKSTKASDHIRASLRSSRIYSSQSESLAASLHKGLQIIDHHQRNSGSNKASVSFSFEHLALGPCQEIEETDASIQTIGEEKGHTEEQKITFLCASCKRAGFSGSDQVNDSLNKWIVPVDKARASNQISKVEQYKHEREQNSVAAIVPFRDLENQKESLLEENKELQDGTDHECKSITYDLSERDALLKEINNLKCKLQSNDASLNASRKSCNYFSSLNKGDEELEKERQRWTEMESQWISLTEELRIDLESNRRCAENAAMELELEKKVTSELDDAISRAVHGHARFVEHYADLQEKYDELLSKHRKINEWISEVKAAATKAGAKGNGSRFAKAFAAELSASRAQKEKEREYLKKENKSLKVQLRDTAEAVHAAGELLVRLREAEEAVAIAEENFMQSQTENEKLRKQMEKQKRKHQMEMVTMKQYLAESRLPESALRPVDWQEEHRADNAAPLLDDDQAWKAEFGSLYQDHY